MLSDAELKRIAHQTEIQTLSTESLRRFEHAIRADEREACARVCDEMEAELKNYCERNYSAEDAIARDLAAAIRARKEKK